jgi:ATP-dependent helicase/nuclease subunit B
VERLARFDLADDAEVRAELERRFSPDTPISVTRLENFRYCPYRFYIEQVLGVEPTAEPEYRLEPTQWGSILHSALERLYRRRLVPLDEIPDRLSSILPDLLKAEGLPRFWQLAVTRVCENLLPEFIKLERAARAEGYQPVGTELRLQGRVAPDLSVKGRLDRLDQGPDGYRVIDYKTGQARATANAVRSGEHLQLPLYARLLQAENRGAAIANIGILSLREMSLRWLVDDKTPLAELIEAAVENARALVQAIRAARFAEISPKSCWRCENKALCPAVRRTADTENATAD